MDVYLLELARRHRGGLATFDAGIQQFVPQDRAGMLEVISTDQ